MKKIITIAMIICMILTTTVFAAIPKGVMIQEPLTDHVISPMGSIIAIIRVILTLLPLVLFLITFICAIRWVINNKKDKESEKTKKISKKAIGFAIATVVSFGVYIIFSGIVIPLTKMAGVL